MAHFRSMFLRIFTGRLKQKAGVSQTPQCCLMILCPAVKFRHCFYPRKDTKRHEKEKLFCSSFLTFFASFRGWRLDYAAALVGGLFGADGLNGRDVFRLVVQ